MKTKRFTTCPRCGYPEIDTRSSKGGKAGSGQAKARTSEQARAAANARWCKKKSPPGKKT